MVDLAQTILTRRVALGLTQSEAADRCDLNEATIVQIERRQAKNPSPLTRGKLARGLDLPVEQVLHAPVAQPQGASTKGSGSNGSVNTKTPTANRGVSQPRRKRGKQPMPR